jgi:hypothetical protein
MKKNPGVYITFDVECSMGGAWRGTGLKPIPPSRGMMGIYGDKAYGLPLICDILARYDLKATFFLEPFNDELGYPDQTEPVCNFLLDKGQDVQLHVHPGHVNYGFHMAGKPFPRTDKMDALPVHLQKEMIEDGASRIESWIGKKPIAFRAGNMAASENTLKLLPETGIWIDSSYTFPYLGGQCRFSETEAYNGSKWYGNVLEVALSGFRLRKMPMIKPSQPIDLMGTSFKESRDAVKKICDSGADAVVILHSFSLFKWRDAQYNGGRLNWVVKRRFERFCEWLSENREKYPARTFSELGKMVKEDGYEPKAVPPCRLNTPFRALTRKAVQALNNFHYF